jgi:SAM-dependent methyltransferase
MVVRLRRDRVRASTAPTNGDTLDVRPDEPFAVVGDITAESIDLEGYLFMNQDVAVAAQGAEDAKRFAHRHWQNHGIDEHRLQLLTQLFPTIVAARTTKMARLFDRSPGSKLLLEDHREEICSYSMPSMRVRGNSPLPLPYERVSSNSYDPELEAWCDEDATSLFLDMGAGLRSVYRPNVVYVEIAALPTTDLLAFGDALPFDDGSFDGAICLAVLEHVSDPFAVAKEIVRVVRPGGRLVIDWPFLQPVHGYPNHYFNATEQGARLAFERMADVATVESHVPLWFHPAFTLRWFLDEWLQRLPERAGQAFQDLTVREVLAQDMPSLLGQNWSTELPENGRSTISAGTRVTVTKKL